MNTTNQKTINSLGGIQFINLSPVQFIDYLIDGIAIYIYHPLNSLRFIRIYQQENYQFYCSIKSKGELGENVFQMKENIELKHLKPVVFDCLSHKDLKALKYG